MNYSIITCTYNPQEELLTRVIKAVIALKTEGIERDFIIVDNNSPHPIAELDYVKTLITPHPWIKIIVEQQQGLNHARIAGLNSSQGEFIIFFDDDNEPNSEYLLNTHHFLTTHIPVGVIGPGHVDIEFIGQVEEWVKKYTRGLFQEKQLDSTVFANNLNDASIVPFGTGMVVSRSILTQYANDFKSLAYKTTDRSGNSLASAGDSQIVYTAFKLGYPVAVVPNLYTKHLIPAKRTSLNYICRLYYGIYSTYDQAVIEIFPEEQLRVSLPSLSRIIKDLLEKIIRIRHKQLLYMDLAAYVGKLHSLYKVKNKKLPFFINFIIRFLNLA